MNTNQILAAINQPKNKRTTAHAAQLANIYRLLKEIKESIISIELQDTVLMFGRETELSNKYSWVDVKVYDKERIILNEGTELPAKQFNVTTNHGGTYKFTIPTGNGFFIAVCTLLNVNAEFISPAPEPEVKESIFVEAGVIEAINQAAKFVSKDWLRPTLQGICLDIKNGFLTVVATDAFKLYTSVPLKCSGPDKEIIIKPTLGKLLPIKDSNTVEIQVMETNVSINQTIFEVIDAKPLDYPAVIPNYDQFMEFETKEFINQVKKVLPYANKVTSQVVLHLNGSINLKTQDLDFMQECSADMPYISKNFRDTDIGFNGKLLLQCLKEIKADKVRMYSAGQPNRGAIFSADQQKSKILLMPVMLNA